MKIQLLILLSTFKNMENKTVKLLFLMGVFAIANASQTYPGTSKRPILSASEAVSLSEKKYLQEWSLGPISIPSTPDFIVGFNEVYTDIQVAVNDAFKKGGTKRQYIEILPGTYEQTVYIPNGVPLTLYGSGHSPSDVNISLNLYADMAVSEWINQVNPDLSNRYLQRDPSYSIYNQCASKTDAIGRACSSIVWIAADNFQLSNLQIHNTYSGSDNYAALALQIESDKVTLSNVRLISHQATLWAGSKQSENAIQRIYVNNSYIEGDEDFVAGSGSAVFRNTTFYAVSGRNPSAIVFAPSTSAKHSYGFLVVDSLITGDSGFVSTKNICLAQSWDGNAAKGQYSAGVSPNGQLLIRNSQIDDVIDVTNPYASSTSGRSFCGNIDSSRDLNNNTKNRFYEYQNTGDGA